jgi:micrococcal nuclease
MVRTWTTDASSIAPNVKFATKFALAVIGSNLMPPADTPAAQPVVCKGTVCQPSAGIPRKTLWRQQSRGTDATSCPDAYIVDGDTLRCGSTRIRLLGIDAPEIEHCPRWRTCAPGDGQASKRSLIAALRNGRLSYQPVTHDRFGRIVAVVWAGGVNLSCWQLKQGQAMYKPHWDNGGTIARDCR